MRSIALRFLYRTGAKQFFQRRLVLGGMFGAAPLLSIFRRGSVTVITLVTMEDVCFRHVLQQNICGNAIDHLGERPDSYPPRLRVPIDEAPWGVECLDYTPPYHVDPSVLSNDRSEKAGGWAVPFSPGE